MQTAEIAGSTNSPAVTARTTYLYTPTLLVGGWKWESKRADIYTIIGAGGHEHRAVGCRDPGLQAGPLAVLFLDSGQW